MRDIESQIEKILQLHDVFVREQLPLRRGSAPLTRWSYDARLPNLYFPEAYEPEFSKEQVKRWVNQDGRIRGSLAIDRNVQYDFVIEIVSFITDAARQSFSLKVNGQTYNWLSVAQDRFWTIVLEDPQASTLDFELSIDPAARAEGESVSFAFSHIDIRQRH
ncbi:hypothetical protein CR162_19860 [Pseudoroseomonas rhizosphaerae]|uniref:Uncharacterized protein n=1 Tax=Teichococcus rhizosphaerae TaxID=1335062 RepID=A0A2C7A6G3_9PROT|nr:hypothetical protein CR162_19860 [Pseudoroseomonas rhizosphaerae]